MFCLYVVLADLWGHEGRYDLRPQAMCMRLARAMWVLWFERVWSWELPTLKKGYLKKYIYNLLDPRGSEMFFLYVVLADLWGHVGRYDLRPQAMCMRPGKAMRVLWFERVWSWELPTLKKIYITKNNNLLYPRGSEMFFLYVVLADLWGHVGKIWSETPSYVYETWKGHESALVWKGLKLGTSNTQKNIYYKKIIIFFTQEVLRCFFSM